MNTESSKPRKMVRVLGGVVFVFGLVPLTSVYWNILSSPGPHITKALLYNLAPLTLICGLWIVIGCVLMTRRG